MNKMRKISIKAEKLADFIESLNGTINTYRNTNATYLENVDGRYDDLDHWDKGCYDRNAESIEALSELIEDLERVKL